MKKLISIGKTILLAILFILGNTNICSADVYVSPTEDLKIAIPVVGVVLAILGVLLLIAIVCIIIAKATNSEELFNKSKSVSENLFYYIILLIELEFVISILSFYFESGVLPLVLLWVSLFLRLKSKNKNASYTILLIIPPLYLLLLFASALFLGLTQKFLY